MQLMGNSKKNWKGNNNREYALVFSNIIAITTSINISRTTLRQQAQERIKQDLIPSFKKIRNFIEVSSRS